MEKNKLKIILSMTFLLLFNTNTYALIEVISGTDYNYTFSVTNGSNAPLTGAVCTVDIIYPNLTLKNKDLTAIEANSTEQNGIYYVKIGSTFKTTGIYTLSVYCEKSGQIGTGGEKFFVVENNYSPILLNSLSNLTAQQVWEYSIRVLTDYNQTTNWDYFAYWNDTLFILYNNNFTTINESFSDISTNFTLISENFTFIQQNFSRIWNEFDCINNLRTNGMKSEICRKLGQGGTGGGIPISAITGLETMLSLSETNNLVTKMSEDILIIQISNLRGWFKNNYKYILLGLFIVKFIINIWSASKKSNKKIN